MSPYEYRIANTEEIAKPNISIQHPSQPHASSYSKTPPMHLPTLNPNSPGFLAHHSPHPSSSFFAGFFIALVPIPLGFLLALAVCALLSPALENSSQKSFLSSLGPFGGAPKESQKSFFSGSLCGARLYEPEGSGPSTKRLRVVPAFATPDWMPCPTKPAVLRAWEARSASAS